MLLVLECLTWLKLRILSNKQYQWFSTYDLSKWHGETYECIHLVTATYCYQWRGYKVSGNMTDNSYFLRLRIFPRLVCERQTSNSSSSGGICGCFKFFWHILFHTKRYYNHKKPQVLAYCQETLLKSKLFFFDYLKAHTKEKYTIINICIVYVLCLIILTYTDL